MTIYYVVRDHDRIRTIHMIKDSAETAFTLLMKEPAETGPSVLELVCITTDQFGKVLRSVLACTWTRRSGVIVKHMADITEEYLMV
jgi:hypothetical protein